MVDTIDLQKNFLNSPLADIDELKTIDVSEIINGVVLYVQDVGGVSGFFSWDETSVLTNNDLYVIQPTGHVGAGRWIRQSLPMRLTPALKISSEMLEVDGAFLFKGEIEFASDFPTLAEVKNGWLYYIKANVIDNDPTKTNTGQSFLAGDMIAFVVGTPNKWIDVTGREIWLLDTINNDIKVISEVDVNLQSKGLKDDNTTTAIKIADSENTAFETENKTIIGSSNELKDRIDHLHVLNDIELDKNEFVEYIKDTSFDYFLPESYYNGTEYIVNNFAELESAFMIVAHKDRIKINADITIPAGSSTLLTDKNILIYSDTDYTVMTEGTATDPVTMFSFSGQVRIGLQNKRLLNFLHMKTTNTSVECVININGGKLVIYAESVAGIELGIAINGCAYIDLERMEYSGTTGNQNRYIYITNRTDNTYIHVDQIVNPSSTETLTNFISEVIDSDCSGILLVDSCKQETAINSLKQFYLLEGNYNTHVSEKPSLIFYNNQFNVATSAIGISGGTLTYPFDNFNMIILLNNILGWFEDGLYMNVPTYGKGLFFLDGTTTGSTRLASNGDCKFIVEGNIFFNENRADYNASEETNVINLKDVYYDYGLNFAFNNKTLTRRHNSLLELQSAGAGVTYGHVTDTTQTFAGDKTFSGQLSTTILNILGCENVTTRTITTNRELDETDNIIYFNGTGTATIRLPDVATIVGRKYLITIINTGTVVIDPHVAQLINGSATFTFTGIYNSVLITNDGTKWFASSLSHDIDVWTYDGVNDDVKTTEGKDVNLGTKGLKDTNVTTAILLGDALNTSFVTPNKTIAGAINYLSSKIVTGTNDILSSGRKEVFAGNNGLGQSAVPNNTAIILNYYTAIAHSKGANAFVDGCFNGDYLYLAPLSSDAIFKINIATGGITQIPHGQGSSAFNGIISDGINLWLVPLNSPNIVKFDVALETFTQYSHGQGSGAFSGGTFDGRYIWLAPLNSANIIKLDPLNGSFITIAHGKGTNAFSGAIFDGTKVWLVPYRSNAIAKINITTNALTFILHGKPQYAYRGGCFDGHHIWFAPYNSAQILKIEVDTDVITEIDTGLGETASLFYGVCFDGTSVWLAPHRATNIYKINPLTNTFATYAHGQADYAFAGAIFDGYRVWFVPFSSANIVNFVPAEFGKNTLNADDIRCKNNISNGGTITAGGAITGSNLSGTNTGDQIVPTEETASTGYYIDSYNATTGDFTKSQVRLVDNTDVASASNVGTLRYRVSGNVSYTDICMQTGASAYEWVNLVQNDWS